MAKPVMKIISSETSVGYMIINREDYDRETMKSYTEEMEKKAEKIEKEKLGAYAEKAFGTKVDKRKSVKAIKEEIKKVEDAAKE